MIDYKNLLCPVDFSDTSKHALSVAADFAERLDAGLHIVHVYQLPASSYPEGVFDVPDDLESNIEKQLSKKLDDFVKSNCKLKTNITTDIYEGVTHTQIVNAANDKNADMIIMGTHGRTGVSHALIGSVAERVVRTSKVPVLTIR